MNPKKARSNIDIDQLKRSKYSSAESKLEWLFSAASFGKEEKRIIKK